MYELLVGKHPFYKKNMGKENYRQFLDELKDQSEEEALCLDKLNISEGAKDLLSTLLKVSTPARMQAKRALQHPWITKEGGT